MTTKDQPELSPLPCLIIVNNQHGRVSQNNYLIEIIWLYPQKNSILRKKNSGLDYILPLAM